MRQAAWILSVILAVGIILVIGRLMLGGGQASSGEAAAGASSGDQERGGGDGGGGEDAVLAQLRAEIDRSLRPTYRTDAQRMADALAWVAANRSVDWPYGDIEASLLALFDGIAELGMNVPAAVLDAAAVEIELVRSLDVDGDGRVSDEEFALFEDVGVQMLLEFSDHPCLLAKFDLDGDGVLSVDERYAIPELTHSYGLFEGVLGKAIDGLALRVGADKWDDDGDGLLSVVERETGRQKEGLHAKIFDDGHIEYVADPGENVAQENADALMRMAEMYGDQAALNTGTRHDGAVSNYMTIELREAIRLVELDRAGFGDRFEEPTPPVYSDFDLDGDGNVDPDRDNAYKEAWVDYGQKVEHINALKGASVARRRFENAMIEHDSNNDGRLSAGEWDDRLNDLVASRTERLFLLHYDLDNSGSVGQAELQRFMGWYEKGGLRADANFDGRVDVGDLEAMVASYLGQD